MKIKTLSCAILMISAPCSGVFAAAMDRSGQSISAFLQSNNYFEAGISVLEADVSGNMRSNWNMPSTDPIPIGSEISGSKLGDMAESFLIPNFTLKYQANEHISLGLIYDQPFGAKAKYSNQDAIHPTPPELLPGTTFGKNVFDASGAFHRNGESTEVSVDSQNLSLLVGYQPNENWNFYAGPVYQGVKGDVKLRGSVYGPLGGGLCSVIFENTIPICTDMRSVDTKQPSNGYTAKIPEQFEWGYLAGFAFQIPKIALKTSLTYRSEIDYKVDVKEDMAYAGSTLFAIPGEGLPILAESHIYQEGKTKITTPQSLNLDFQSGIMENTIAYINVRWVDWSKFKIRPQKFGELSSALTQKVAGTPRGFDLIAYDKDQISATFGVARKFNDKWAVSLIGGWDSGTGELASTLGPVDGYWSAGLGAQFSSTPSTFIQAGARYFWFGDAKAQSASWFGTERYDADFENNTALGYSMKIGYKF